MRLDKSSPSSSPLAAETNRDAETASTARYAVLDEHFHSVVFASPEALPAD